MVQTSSMSTNVEGTRPQQVLKIIRGIFHQDEELRQQRTKQSPPVLSPTLDHETAFETVAAAFEAASSLDTPIFRDTVCQTGFIHLTKIAKAYATLVHISEERNDLLQQREIWAQERDKWSRERETLLAERETWQIERQKQEASQYSKSATPKRAKPDSSSSENSCSSDEDYQPPSAILKKKCRVTLVPLSDTNLSPESSHTQQVDTCRVCLKTGRNLAQRSGRCNNCKEFWQRLKRQHRKGQELPTCREDDHKDLRQPDKCRGCRRILSEYVFRDMFPGRPPPIPSLLQPVEGNGSLDGAQCNNIAFGLDKIPFLPDSYMNFPTEYNIHEVSEMSANEVKRENDI